MALSSRFLIAVGVVALSLPASAGAARVPGWRGIATPADRDRMRNWRTAWIAALAKADASGHGADVRAEGVLLQPDAGLIGPMPPPGDYRCRVTKLGGKGPGMADFAAYPAFACRIAIEGDVTSFAKLDGSQRPVGLLFPSDPQRMVFLGTMMLSDERTAQQYGRDPERDMAGIVERIGPARWRMVLPYPRWESTLDVIELTPAPAQKDRE